MSKKLTTEEFIIKARLVHGDKYNYSKVNYINTMTKVCIICPTHGEFLQTPNSHLQSQICPKCGRINVAKKLKSNTDDFIEKAKVIHNDKYDYSKVKYINVFTKISIICQIHGEYEQTPNKHLNGRGCQQCAKTLKLTTEEFIEKAKEVHGDRYNYYNVEYINNNTKVCIICKEHGEFWQKSSLHLIGHGCPKCNISKLENETTKILNNNNVEFEYQKRFEWLGLQSLDFYIPQLNIAIECQGEQHFKSVKYFGGENGLKKRQLLDNKKKQLCEQHNITLHYINYDENVENKLNEILKKYV